MAAGRQYTAGAKRRIGSFLAANVLFYVLTIILLVFSSQLPILALIVGLRYALIFPVYTLSARRLQEKISLPLLPVLDVVYFFNYLLLGVSVLMYKKIRWK